MMDTLKSTVSIDYILVNPFLSLNYGEIIRFIDPQLIKLPILLGACPRIDILVKIKVFQKNTHSHIADINILYPSKNFLPVRTRLLLDFLIEDIRNKHN